MRQFSTNPVEMVGSVWRNRALIWASVLREVLGRYRGSFMGLAWSLFNPLFMLVIYTFVFSQVFKARWSAGSHSKTEFALLLFAGLIVFNLFAECVNRAPGLILANVNYVKKVVFPLEILPWVAVGASLFHAAVSLLAWLIVYGVLYGWPHATALYLPLIFGPLVLLIMGFSWALASLGVFLRDVAQFIGIATSALMFLSPIFYPASSLPQEYEHLLYLNPLTAVIEQAREVLFWGRSPDFLLLAQYWGATALVAWVGFAWFQRTRKGFADVL
jgi:lipopolysaccharide transport system permease protein